MRDVFARRRWNWPVCLLAGLGMWVGSGEVAHGQKVPAHRVFGSDERQAVADTTQLPWSSIGMVVAHWGPAAGFQVRVGTGTLISPHVVLTSGHVVMDEGVGWAQLIVFFPGRNPTEDPLGSFRVSQGITTPEWASEQDNDYDLAMLLLDEAAGESVGIMRVASESAGFFVDRALNMTGYPSDLIEDQMYTSTGSSQRVEGNVIHHLLDGAQGQSGGPLWFNDPQSGEPLLVGIYAGDVDVTQGGLTLESYGYAIHINAEFCAWIGAYVNEHDPGTEISCAPTQGVPTPFSLPMCGSGLNAAACGAALWLMAMTAYRKRG